MLQSESVERIFVTQHRVPKRGAERKREQRGGDAEGRFKKKIVLFSRKTNTVVPTRTAWDESARKAMLPKREDLGTPAPYQSRCAILHL